MKRKIIKIIIVAGARPNFIKAAPLLKEFKKYRQFKPILVHTGQHYDYNMSGSFFKELDIPKPDYNLEVGSGTHAWQTAEIMKRLEKVILKERPKSVIVVGDVNSTLAGALTAAKLHIPVVHIEAGLRSFDMSMPEEINRVLTDRISDFLFVTEPSGIRNLVKEGISRKKIFYVGNIMIDTLKNQKPKIKNKRYKPKIFKQLNLKPKKYAVLTLHRPSNVDDRKILKNLLETFKIISQKIPIIFPIHPRTKKQIKKFKLKIKICLPTNRQGNCKLKIVTPLGYIDMLSLMANSKFVLTDSGGIQEETTVLKIPCLTLRENTERPITVEIGTNTIVGRDRNEILKQVNKILSGKYKKGKIPKYWDGKTAERIVKFLRVG